MAAVDMAGTAPDHAEPPNRTPFETLHCLHVIRRGLHPRMQVLRIRSDDIGNGECRCSWRATAVAAW